jgi:hypothetical protein
LKPYVNENPNRQSIQTPKGSPYIGNNLEIDPNIYSAFNGLHYASLNKRTYGGKVSRGNQKISQNDLLLILGEFSFVVQQSTACFSKPIFLHAAIGLVKNYRLNDSRLKSRM